MAEEKMLYFDNAATTWPKPETVYQAVDKALRSGGSPGRSEHATSLAAERLVFNSRERVSSFLGIEDPASLIFTLNATDSLNMAIKGVLEEGDHVIITPFEHNSVLRPLNSLVRDGKISVTELPLTSAGIVDLEALPSLIRDNTRMVISTHASNVTGQIMPVAEIGTLCKQKGIYFLVDAAQTAGVYPVKIRDLNADLLVFAGHKGLLGPQGVGGLYIDKNVKIKPWREGGTGSRSEEEFQPELLPDYLEAGTMNVPGIAGLEAGVKFIEEVSLEKIRSHEIKLAGMLRQGLKNIPGVRIFGPSSCADGVAVVSFEIDQVDSGNIGFILEEVYGILCRTGLHCAPKAHNCIGTYPRGTIRLSPGYFTTEEDVNYVLKAVKEIAEEAQ